MNEPKHIFNKEQLHKANYIVTHPMTKLSDISSQDIERLIVLWSFYSGRIEGNTYTYVETERLLKEDITAEKKRTDSVMLLNMRDTFQDCLEKTQTESMLITKDKILSLHAMLMEGLLDTAQVGTFRSSPVFITNTDYIPPRSQKEIIPRFEDILEHKESYTHPLEQAVYLHCNMAKLQPFHDGNKRTARLLESIVLMNNNLIPVYSRKDQDIKKYLRTLLAFYEHDNYTPYVEYFLDRQLARISQLQMYQEIHAKGHAESTAAESPVWEDENENKTIDVPDLPSMPDLSKTNGMTM